MIDPVTEVVNDPPCEHDDEGDDTAWSLTTYISPPDSWLVSSSITLPGSADDVDVDTLADAMLRTVAAAATGYSPELAMALQRRLLIGGGR